MFMLEKQVVLHNHFYLVVYLFLLNICMKHFFKGCKMVANLNVNMCFLFWTFLQTFCWTLLLFFYDLDVILINVNMRPRHIS